MSNPIPTDSTGLGLVPAAPLPNAVRPPARPRFAGRAASPFYLRYLDTQVKSIRLHGGDDAAVNQFLDMEERKPLTALPPVNVNATPDEVARATLLPSHLQGVSMALLQGATFGWGDETIIPLLHALSGQGARESTEEFRKEYAAWASLHGKENFVAQLAGGALTAGIGAGAAAGGGILRGAATAASFGAVAGAGSTDGELGDRAWGALTGAGLGAAGGLVLGGAGRFVAAPVARALARTTLGGATISAVERTTRFVTRRELVSVTPQARAREELVQRLIADGITTPEQLAARVATLQAQGILPTVLTVGGDATADLAGAAYKMRSPKTTASLEKLKQLRGQQPDRIIAAFLQHAVQPQRLGLANIYDVEDMLHKTAISAAQPHYDEAFEKVVQLTPRLSRLLRHPALRAAYQRGARDVRDEALAGTGHGLPVPGLARGKAFQQARAMGMSPERAREFARLAGEAPPPTELPVRGIDGMKRELDAIIEEKLLAKNPNLSPSALQRLKAKKGRTLFAMRDEIIAEARTQVPAYDRALTTYEGPESARESVQLGAKMWRMTPQAITRHMTELSLANRDFARIGYAREAYTRMISAKPASAARRMGGRLFGEPSARDAQVRAMFYGAVGPAERFSRLVAGQALVSDRTGQVVRLARNITTQPFKELSEGSLPSVRGTPAVAAASALRTTAQSALRMSQQEADELTHLFMKGATDPADLTVLMHDLFYTYRGVAARPLIKRVSARLLGQQVGLAQ
jgi:hypothetical protein